MSEEAKQTPEPGSNMLQMLELSNKKFTSTDYDRVRALMTKQTACKNKWEIEQRHENSMKE